MKWPFGKSRTIRVYDQFKGKISYVDISKLQYYIGYDLPDQYKCFLSKHNGGRVEPNAFDTATNQISSSIQFFYGITEKTNYDIQTNYDLWRKRDFPKQYLPIACDSLGNYIIIDLTINNYGHVLFWSHDNPEFRPVKINHDFDSFLNNLYEITIEKSDLDIAIDNEDIEYFKQRIANGEHVDSIKNEFGQTVVIRASLLGKINLIKFFKANGSKMEKALFNAARNGHYELVKYLLSIGLDPNERDVEQNNETVLINASYGGHIGIVKMLIEAGAGINAVDKHGQSVLRKAIWSDNQELISYLEKLGAIDSY